MVFVKQTFMDLLLGRSLQEKIDNYCHVECISTLGCRNFKKNGRWGFRHMFGCSELFSSLFAFLSFIMSVIFVNKLIKPKMRNMPLRPLILAQYYICNIAFISSTLFHMRETFLTRYADYLSAYLSIMIGFICSLGRAVHRMYPAHLYKFTRISLVLGTLSFAFHLYKMVFIRWDYFYNKIVCGSMFAICCLTDLGLWWREKDQPYLKNAVKYVAGLLLAGVIEICDLSPAFFLFDSHAMWHLLMATSSVFYYRYLAGYLDACGHLD